MRSIGQLSVSRIVTGFLEISANPTPYRRETTKNGANGSDIGFYFPLSGICIQKKVPIDGFHQIAEGDGRCISEGKDLAGEKFVN